MEKEKSLQNQEEIKKALKEIFDISEQEVANILEIMDGGYMAIPNHLVEQRLKLLDGLKTIRDILLESIDEDITKARHEYHLISKKEEYFNELGKRLERIKEIIDSGKIHPNLTQIFSEEINKCLEAYREIISEKTEEEKT